MHGIIHSELKKYVVSKLGPEAWNALVEDAGLSGTVHDPGKAYPDDHALALVEAAVRATGLEAGAILEDFGEFLGPHLLAAYSRHVSPDWRTLDMLESTESTIHRVVRANNPTATPPELDVKRVSRTRVTIRYSSPRKMCAVARGIIKGAAKHYGETVEIREPRCMLNGDGACEIEVTLAS